MLTTRVADATETTTWRRQLDHRLTDWYGSRGAPGNAATRAQAWDSAPGELLVLDHDGTRVGHLALCHRGSDAIIYDLWIDPAHRGQGHGRAALRRAETWAAERPVAPTRINAQLWTDDPAQSAIFADYPVRAQKMIKKLSVASPYPAGISVRPLAEPEYDDWVAEETEGFAEQVTAAGLSTAAEARIESATAFAQLLPDRLATPGHTIWLIESADAEVLARIWLKHNWNAGVSFVYSVEVLQRHRGRGLGRVAMLAGEEKCLAAGDDYLALNVFGYNTVAINLYERLGYAVFDQLRSREIRAAAE